MITLYCSEKLDGIAAAAIIKRHAQLNNLPTRFGGFLHPENITDELEEIAKEEQQLIFILDASIAPEHLTIIDRILARNKIVYWNTHDAKSVVPPAKIFDKAIDKNCAAELAQQRFIPKDLIAKQLAQLAHDIEFWQLGDERAIKLTDLITAQYSPLELIDALSKGIFWNDQFETIHKQYLEKKNAALEELLKTLVIKTYLNYRFGYVLAANVLTTADACQRVLDGHAGVDVSIALYRNGKIAFRKRDSCNLDVSELAHLFNGGGNQFAAGAKLNTTITKENSEEVIFQLDTTFKNYFIEATTFK